MRIVNGIDVDKMADMISTLRANPEVANFRFKADAEWINGARSRTGIKSSSGRTFVLEADEPPVLLGSDLAPNAVEAVLHALASCLIVSFVYNAAARGINVKALSLALEGDLDLRGFLGLSENIRPGYQNIRVRFSVKSDAPGDQLEELCKYAQRASPVTDIVRNGVPVFVRLEEQAEEG